MAGPTLYIHIGIPKTATTYLQELVFPGLEGVRYAGTPRADRFRTEDDLREEQRLFVCALRRNHTLWSEVGDDLFAAMLGDKSGWSSAPTNLLISDEGIGRAGSRHAILGRHMEAIAATAKNWGFQRLRILCVVRRQDHWLASHYAQISDRKPAASQQDFEATVARVLDPYAGRHGLGALLDFDRLYELLCRVVGKGNVLMLPYEMLTASPQVFHEKAFGFFGCTSTAATMPANAETRRNVRTAGQNEWRLRPRRMGLGRGMSLPLRRSAGTIHLSPAISTDLLDAYSNGNRRLAEALNIDLAGYGYF